MEELSDGNGQEEEQFPIYYGDDIDQYMNRDSVEQPHWDVPIYEQAIWEESAEKYTSPDLKKSYMNPTELDQKYKSFISKTSHQNPLK